SYSCVVSVFLLSSVFFIFWFLCSCDRRDLLSFPTRRSSDLFNPCFGFFYSFIFPVNNVPKQRVRGPTPLRGGCFLKYSDTPLNFRSLHLSLLGSSNSLIVLDRRRLLQINALLTAIRHLHLHSGHYDVQILFHHESIYRYFPLSKRVY